MMVQVNLRPSVLLHVQLICLLVLMAQDAFLKLKSVMYGSIVGMDLMKVHLLVPSTLSVQMMSLLVLMASNVFLNHIYVKNFFIVTMVQTNPCAPLHVQLICLHVLMAYNVFLIQKFAMGSF